MLQLLGGAAFAAVAAAHKEYVPLNPNGALAGVAAIGHVNPNGGGKTNQYGHDFDKAGKKWTLELCQMDSDGDGQTNGLELGDPCCVWAVGQTPANSTAISNPGDRNSKTTRDCKVEACPNGVTPCTPKAPTLRGKGKTA